MHRVLRERVPLNRRHVLLVLSAGVAISLLAMSMPVSAQASPPQTPAQSKSSPPPASSSQPITYGGGDGTTCDRAIVVEGAHGEADGIHSEYDWLKSHYPGYKMVKQAALNDKNKMYDLLELRDKDGKPRSVCFDITAFYGHF